MKRYTPVALVAVLAALAVPSVAAAKTVSLHSVRAQVTTATRQLNQLNHLVAANSPAATAKLARVRRTTITAAHDAQALVGKLTSNKTSLAPASALSMVISLFQREVGAYASLIPSADDAAVKEALAKAIPGSIAGREQLLNAIYSVLDKVGAQQKPAVAQIIAVITAEAPKQLTSLNGLLNKGVPTNIADVINTAISAVTAGLDTAFAHIDDVVAMLPVELQGPIAQLLATVKTTIGSVLSMVTNQSASWVTPLTGLFSQFTGIFNNMFGGLFHGLPGVSEVWSIGGHGGVPSLGGIQIPGLSGFPGISQILGGFLPKFGV